MKCSPGRHHFLLDPKFPNRLKESGYLRSIDFAQFLFQKYAKSGLTETEDRIVAIHSLMERMGNVFNTEARYGTFTLFLHRLLLWHRSDEKIPENVHETYGKIPSWSWMTYHGIEFLQIVRLKIANVQFGTGSQEASALIVQVREFQACEAEQQHKSQSQYRVLNTDFEEVGEVWFDVEKNCLQYCVVIGMEDDYKEDDNKTCYILIVQETGSNKYERVGIGKIKARYVCHKSHDGRLM